MTNKNKQIAIARAVKARLDFNIGTASNIDIFEKFKNEKNFSIVFMPFDKEVDGFSHKRKNHFIIVINSNNCNSRNNFTCAHELYHLLFEYDGDRYVSNENSEEMANVFASYFLVPEDALYLYLQNNGMIRKNRLSLSDIVKIEDYFQVSRLAILIRLKDENLITQGEFDEFNKNVLSSVKRYGGKIKDHIENIVPSKCTIGEYNQMAKQLLECGKISTGKYEQYMIEAFNAREVYGDLEGE